MDLVGKMLAGRYEILEEVGKGGMAHVYKARCHILNRFVAIKVLKEELRDDKEFVTRFNTEAQAAARISNPHVVSIFDVGFENGLYYIVMEFVEGITLKEYIAEEQVLPWRTAADFAAQICEGLAAAHRMSVIHRDIKPQNVIMTAGNVLKITDFGIARATSQATTTTANSTIGTVHYLSPEQARGGYTSEKTDIYSLGVVLYEMLTGRLPFDDNTAVAIAIKHIQEKPILPRILNNDIPEAMEYIVMKAMNKEQGMRYASAEEFLNDLRAVIKNPDADMSASVPSYVDDEEDIGATRKRSAIDDDMLDDYRSMRKNDDMEYDAYSERRDKEKEESQLRNLDRKRAIREQKKKERRVTIAAIIAAIAVIAGMAVVFSAMSGGGLFGIFESSEKVDIPNVIDMKLDDAQRKYKSDGFSIIKVSEKADDKEAGTILEQNPPAGNSVTKRDDIVIRVVISKGNVTKKLPNYTGIKVDEAKKKIADDGFKVNIVRKESSSEKKDVVISQEPSEGSDVAEGALVTLYVSNGDGKDEDSNNNSDSNNSNNNNSSNNNSNNNSNANTNTQNPGTNNEGNSSTGSGTGQNMGGGTTSQPGGGTGSSESPGGTGGGSSAGEGSGGNSAPGISN